MNVEGNAQYYINNNGSKDTFYRPIPYGIQWRGSYEHTYKNCDIVGGLHSQIDINYYQYYNLTGQVTSAQ